ncbi:hypothetical protein L9F63_019828, partial [Diploptera punctata]
QFLLTCFAITILCFTSWPQFMLLLITSKSSSSCGLTWSYSTVHHSTFLWLFVLVLTCYLLQLYNSLIHQNNFNKCIMLLCYYLIVILLLCFLYVIVMLLLFLLFIFLHT